MYTYYTDEKNHQIFLALLKANGIKKVIASPGTTNISLVKSFQNDSFFEMYSSVDERSAAYMACGLAEESGETVVLSCTGATASRNYFPGLTEAYYRKLPILAVTSSQGSSRIGQNIAQVTNRNEITADVVKKSVLLQIVKDKTDWEDCEIKANYALLELKHNGGGPVHINLETTYSHKFDVKELPKVKLIERIVENEDFPLLKPGRIGIFVGSHKKMSKELTSLIDTFCENHNAVVFCDHTSGYRGKYEVQHALSSSQGLSDFGMAPNLTIQLGEISGDYSIEKIIGDVVWRVNEDGEIKDQFGKLTKVFEMPEEVFFNHYNNFNNNKNTYFDYCQAHLNKLRTGIPEVPFSNIWIAQQMHKLIPENSAIHFGILNSLRSWNYFELNKSIDSNSNVGGFGIDGTVSSLVGASLANRDKLYFGIFGDLAFFYDLNSIGNRHISNNVRILLVNNGAGQEFKNYNNLGAKIGDSANEFIAARGHFGNQSKELVKNYSKNLGFDYITASNKEEFKQVYKQFLDPKISDKPIIFEVFTNEEEETDALKLMNTIDVSDKAKAKESIKEIIGQKNVDKIRKIMTRRSL